MRVEPHLGQLIATLIGEVLIGSGPLEAEASVMMGSPRLPLPLVSVCLESLARCSPSHVLDQTRLVPTPRKGVVELLGLLHVFMAHRARLFAGRWFYLSSFSIIVPGIQNDHLDSAAGRCKPVPLPLVQVLL